MTLAVSLAIVAFIVVLCFALMTAGIWILAVAVARDLADERGEWAARDRVLARIRQEYPPCA